MFDVSNLQCITYYFSEPDSKVKKTVEFFKLLVIGKGVQINIENCNFWSWKKMTRKAMENENILSSAKRNSQRYNCRCIPVKSLLEHVM